MSLHTMLGKYSMTRGFFITNYTLLYAARNCSQNKNVWEFTRHRKKPSGGGRLLTNPNEFNQFNAWLVE